MRNLKRALSLALASVMLLGMMVVGSSAAFSDADEIVNKEAVEITAGLGLFAGSDGKFNPKDTVTRAQMAAVIAKMFYGSDLNADTYKGGNKFSDTVSFEGGWAEGYVNLGVEKGWFKGYGDGTFGPGNAVTTAEAVTMLINLLGVDAGEGTWPMTVMAAAEDIELFDMEGFCELKPAPATNVALTRDQLAVMVWNALNYSADGVKGYTFKDSKIKFDTWADAAAYADKWAASGEDRSWAAADIKPIKNDTLAETVFEIQSVTDYVEGNQATGLEYTLVGGTKLNLETGLDVLGHYVTAYFSESFQNEKNPGEAYCLVEEAEYVTVTEAIDTKKDYLAAFGSKVETDGITVVCFDGNHDHTAEEDPTPVEDHNYDEDAFTANPGTYAIDLETGKVFAFIAPVGYTVDVVGRVTTTAGKEAIKIGTTSYNNNEDEDVIVEYEGIAADDVVVLKNFDGITYAEKLEAVADQKVTKKVQKDGKDFIYLNGTAYELVAGQAGAIDGAKDEYADFTASSEITYDAYIYGGKLVAAVETAGAAALSDAIYVVGDYKVEVAGTYAPTDYYYAQGVDAEGKEVSILIGVGEYGDTTESIAEGFYTFKKATTKEEAKRDIMVATAAKVQEDDEETEDINEAFNPDTDKFFQTAVTGTVNANELKKDDKYVYINGGTAAANRVYLNANTKFVVIDSTTIGEELEIVTYTGAIAKAVDLEGEDADTIAVAVSLDANENKIAEMIIINTGSVSLKAEDYIYVVNGADCGAVEGGFEYEVFFTSTNEFKTIVADVQYETGFYGNYTIDEDGIYDLNDAVAEDDDYILTAQYITGFFGETTISTEEIDLYDAANAVIVDVRGEDALEESEVAEIETLGDIKSAVKADYKVIFTAIVDDIDTDEPVVTHIFVTEMQLPVYGEDNEVDHWETEFPVEE